MIAAKACVHDGSAAKLARGNNDRFIQEGLARRMTRRRRQIFQERRERLIPLCAFSVEVLRFRAIVDGSVKIPGTIASDGLGDIHEMSAGIRPQKISRKQTTVAQLLPAVPVPVC